MSLGYDPGYNGPVEDRRSERRVVERVQRWLEESANDKSRVSGKNHESWKYLTDCYDGKDYLSRPWYQAEVRSNKLKARVDRIVGLYIGDRPRVSYEQAEVNDALVAKMLDAAQDSDWHNGGLDRELRAAVQDAAIVGTGFWKTFLEPVGKRIRSRRVNPEHIFVDPDSDLSLISADFVAEIASQPLDKVVRLYPFAFRDDSVALTDDKLYMLSDSLPYAYYDAPPVGTSYGDKMSTPIYRGASRARVLLCQFWIRDIGQIDWLLDDEAKGRLRDEQIRSAVVTLAGNRVLSIEKSPYRLGWHPYTVFRSQIRSNSWWGRGDVEEQISVQHARDVILSRVTHHIQLTVNPTWGVNESLAIDMPTMFEQVPGKVYRFQGAPREALVPMQPPSIPGESLAFMSLLDNDNDDVTGVNEAAQGRKPKGVESGRAIQALQQQLAQRLQPRLDDLRESLKGYGRRYADLALAEYTESMMGRIIGKTTATGWNDLKKTAASEFDVRVQVGTGVELDPETLLESGVQLYQMGVFGQPGSPEANLKLFRAIRRFWPESENEIREGEKAQRAQFDEAARAQAVAPAGGGAPTLPAQAPVAPPTQPAPAPVPV